jgi:hypothetical protein
MGKWSDFFWTSDPETGESTGAKVKSDDSGAVTDFLYGLEKDSDGGHHGHVWNLGPDTNDDDIEGRDPVDKA